MQILPSFHHPTAKEDYQYSTKNKCDAFKAYISHILAEFGFGFTYRVVQEIFMPLIEISRRFATAEQAGHIGDWVNGVVASIENETCHPIFSNH
jgi:hypothetical protein